MHAIVQVPAFDEPADTLGDRLRRIREQAPPDGWDVAFEAWITPTGPSDPTFEIARRAGFETFEAPSGKLSTRNEAHSRAVDAGADAIVTWDADAPPLRDDALVGLLEPLEDADVVAVNSVPGATISPEGGLSLVGMFVDAGGWLEDAVRPHMHGQCSAFSADAWKVAGPFDTSIDETAGKVVRGEEEIGFYHRLNQLGDVVREERAVIFNEPRRHFCRLVPQMAPDGYCDRRGTTTFNRR